MTDGLDKLTQLAEQRWGAGNVLSSYVTVTAFRSLSHPFKTRAYNGDIHRDPEVVRRIIATVCTLPRYRAAPIVFNALDTISNIGGLRPVDVYVQRGRNGHITGVKPISQQPADQRFTDASQARIGGATEITNTDWHAVDALPLGAVRCSFIVNAKVGTPNLT